jgi:hypothetical protein
MGKYHGRAHQKLKERQKISIYPFRPPLNQLPESRMYTTDAPLVFIPDASTIFVIVFSTLLIIAWIALILWVCSVISRDLTRDEPDDIELNI